MPTYLTPGVYVEEVPSANKPIEGVGTSVAAFVGLAPGGPVNKAMRIANWGQFAKLYSDPGKPENGPFMEGAYLAHSVYGYFQNGGGLCWVVRVGGASGDAAVAAAALPSATDATVETFRASALPGVSGPISVELKEEPGAAAEEGKEADKTYKLTVSAGSAKEDHDGLSLKKGRSFIVTKVNAASSLIKLEDISSSLPETVRAPASGSYALTVPSAAPTEVKPSEFAGDTAKREGLGGLAAVDEVTMLVVPDIVSMEDASMRDLQGKMIASCEVAGGRMALIDPPAGLSPQEVYEWRMNTAGYDSKFAALYYPWLEVMDPLTNRPLLIPPSGHMAGVWARTDSTRGVHKAPANEVVMGVNGLAFQVTHSEQGTLNQNGINCIRAFPGRGIRAWGARTMSSDPEWRYLNVRRLFNYVTGSIINGTQWSVFEPNDERLWLQLRVSVANFLTRTWREGALFGSTPNEAFYVKCDSETNPTDVIEAGQVIVEIGICPVKPAEFVIFRISQFAAGAAEIA